MIQARRSAGFASAEERGVALLRRTVVPWKCRSRCRPCTHNPTHNTRGKQRGVCFGESEGGLGCGGVGVWGCAWVCSGSEKRPGPLAGPFLWRPQHCGEFASSVAKAGVCAACSPIVRLCAHLCTELRRRLDLGSSCCLGCAGYRGFSIIEEKNREHPYGLGKDRCCWAEKKDGKTYPRY